MRGGTGDREGTRRGYGLLGARSSYREGKEPRAHPLDEVVVPVGEEVEKEAEELMAEGIDREEAGHRR